MKKSISKTTVVIVLAVFLTLSVGYALFSDTITIEGTATAQGNFDIVGGCVIEFPEDFASEEISEGNGYKNEVCNVRGNSNTVSYSVEFEYPGAMKNYAYSFTNNGTIKAELDFNTVFESMIQETVKVYDSTTNDLKETLQIEGTFFMTVDFVFQDKSGNYITANNDLYINYFDEDNGKIYLNPRETMYLVLQSQWPGEQKFMQDGVYYEAKQTATLNWKQSTN